MLNTNKYCYLAMAINNNNRPSHMPGYRAEVCLSIKAGSFNSIENNEPNLASIIPFALDERCYENCLRPYKDLCYGRCTVDPCWTYCKLDYRLCRWGGYPLNHCQHRLEVCIRNCPGQSPGNTGSFVMK